VEVGGDSGSGESCVLGRHISMWCVFVCR
jgi:hypothetical protein